MNWSDVGNLVAKAAPLLGTALLGPAGGVAGALIASIFGGEPTPDAVAAAIQADPQALLKLRELELTHATELQRMTIQAETARLTEVNATIRTEVVSDDAYVRRMRSTFGYIVCFTLAIESLLICIVVLWLPDRIADMMLLIESFGTVQMTALAVLGVYVNLRSKEKMIDAGHPPGDSLIGAIATRIRGRR